MKHLKVNVILHRWIKFFILDSLMLVYLLLGVASNMYEKNVLGEIKPVSLLELLTVENLN
jgi:hypothetical protein